MATWSEWFKTAGEKGIPLQNYLSIDISADIKRLQQSGLPHAESLVIAGNDDWKRGAKKFFDDHPLVWARIVHKKNPSKRHYKIGIPHFEEFCSFVENLNIDVQEYRIQLFEDCRVRFGGNIVSDGTTLFVEMAIGSQDAVGKSKGTVFHGALNKNGRIEFKEPAPTELLNDARRATGYLKLERNLFLKGYFEFLVSETGQVLFLDYKTNLK